jgi:hypothetical protein
MLPPGCILLIDQRKFVTGVGMKFCVTFVRTSCVSKARYKKKSMLYQLQVTSSNFSFNIDYWQLSKLSFQFCANEQVGVNLCVGV